MANRTAVDAINIHGTNPQFLIEKIIRSRIYESVYWKEECFALTAETIIDKAIELTEIGGQYGQQRPTRFLCLTLKLLQIQPSKEIVLEYILNEDYKYLRALGAFYLRLIGSSREIFEYLEPLYIDYRKLRRRLPSGSWDIQHIDEFIDELLREERVCDTILPRLTKREVLEETGELPPRISVLEEDDDDEEEEEGHVKEGKGSEKKRRSSVDRSRSRSRSASRLRRSQRRPSASPRRPSRRSPSRDPSRERGRRRSSRSPHSSARSRRSPPRSSSRDRHRSRQNGDKHGSTRRSSRSRSRSRLNGRRSLSRSPPRRERRRSPSPRRRRRGTPSSSPPSRRRSSHRSHSRTPIRRKSRNERSSNSPPPSARQEKLEAKLENGSVKEIGEIEEK